MFYVPHTKKKNIHIYIYNNKIIQSLNDINKIYIYLYI